MRIEKAKEERREFILNAVNLIKECCDTNNIDPGTCVHACLALTLEAFEMSGFPDENIARYIDALNRIDEPVETP